MMDSKVYYILSFAVGVAVGAVITAKYIKRNGDDDIYEEEENDHEETVEVIDNKSAAERNSSKGDISEYVSVIRQNDYDAEDVTDVKDYKTVEAPYVISPDDFGEYGYETISLTYYADGVLADDEDNIIDDTENVVGRDYASHFGEYEDDSVFIRNDIRRCDYEILKDHRNYSDNGH